MTEIALAVGFTLFLWWFSTGVIIYLDGLPQRTFVTTMRWTTAVLVAALWGLVHTRDDVSASGAYCAFTCALLVWAWQEVAFLLGMVTGPRREACPPQATGWRRAHLALQTVLYHEFALVVLALTVLACVGPGSNRVGVWTYALLWAMRQSAKLNIFLGVRNLGESLLPPHLAYLSSYFRRRAMNPLFPFSALLIGAATVLAWGPLLDSGMPATGEGAARVLLGTLLALGVLEHVLLVLPLPSDALWRWGLSSHRAKAAVVVRGDGG
ncbi:DUF3623 domain-containing protein [Ideonella sp. 4Y11]|uniref:DUF3623 domain-containing protein n=1 Tax=Ideonella aquatica TaxID=2824119 RepID=A0A941BRK1_9BURK|nr:putative photosynthetic complex assembly protein PuhE [Ideonella aquatica]MBQ0960510.1 DUF3623 domain-containing protein [Ideonella aquatica]